MQANPFVVQLQVTSRLPCSNPSIPPPPARRQVLEVLVPQAPPMRNVCAPGVRVKSYAIVVRCERLFG